MILDGANNNKNKDNGDNIQRNSFNESHFTSVNFIETSSPRNVLL